MPAFAAALPANKSKPANHRICMRSDKRAAPLFGRQRLKGGKPRANPPTPPKTPRPRVAFEFRRQQVRARRPVPTIGVKRETLFNPLSRRKSGRSAPRRGALEGGRLPRPLLISLIDSRVGLEAFTRLCLTDAAPPRFLRLCLTSMYSARIFTRP